MIHISVSWLFCFIADEIYCHISLSKTELTFCNEKWYMIDANIVSVFNCWKSYKSAWNKLWNFSNLHIWCKCWMTVKRLTFDYSVNSWNVLHEFTLSVVLVNLNDCFCLQASYLHYKVFWTNAHMCMNWQYPSQMIDWQWGHFPLLYIPWF